MSIKSKKKIGLNIQNITKLLIVIIGISVLISIMSPTKQRVVIPLLSNYETIFKNKKIIDQDTQIINYSSNLIKRWSANLLDQNDPVVEISQKYLIEEIYKENIKFYLTTVIKNLSMSGTEKEKYFFNNSIYKTKVIINPEDGKASISNPAINYTGLEYFNSREIILLGNKIEEELSKLFFKNYDENLLKFQDLINNVVKPINTRQFDQKIYTLEESIKNVDFSSLITVTQDNQSINRNVKNLNTETTEMLISMSNWLNLKVLELSDSSNTSQEEKLFLVQKMRGLANDVQKSINRLEEFQDTNLRLYTLKNDLLELENRKSEFITDVELVSNIILNKLERNINPVIKSVDYNNVNSFYKKSDLMVKNYYILMAIFNIMLLLIYFIFFRNGLSYFLKNYVK